MLGMILIIDFLGNFKLYNTSKNFIPFKKFTSHT